MVKTAEQLKLGDIVRIEYGLPGNRVNFKVSGIQREENKVKVEVEHLTGKYKESFFFKPEEKVVIA